MTSPFRLELLSEEHDRKAFACGKELLDRYFQTQVTQDIRRRLTNCFVAVEKATGQVAAFYTLSSASIPVLELPAETTKRLPHYPTLPAVRIGRLAVDLRYRGRGLGSGLVADAVRRTLQAPPAAFTLLVDAKDDEAVAFYQRHKFEQVIGQPRTLFLLLATAVKALPQK